MSKNDSAGHERRTEGGKFLTFKLNEEEYGLEILKVREIIGVMEITTVPQAPHHVKGVINLRGKVIPVIDLRLKFGFEEAEYNDETCIIVVNVRDVLMGMLVDTVSEVIDIGEGDIDSTPSFGDDVRVDFILGMAKVDESVKILLDIERVLAGDDFAMPGEMAAHIGEGESEQAVG